MPTTTRRSWLQSSVLGPFAAPISAEGRAPMGQAALSPRERIRDRSFPNVALRTEQGHDVRFYDDLVKGKVVTINFMYAECEGVCPGITANLLAVQRRLGRRVGRDVFMYSITLDPEHDTPRALSAYAR